MVGSLSCIRAGERKLIGAIGDQDTITGLLLAGIGEIASNGEPSAANCILIGKDGMKEDILKSFRSLCDRKEIGIIIINQFIADMIRETIDKHDKIIPVVLEIPSHDHAYDFSKDSIIVKINKLLGEEN
ncbi:v-type proton ATPase subunit F-like protein [Perkinsela sp. CCAP 1560/4]|nr:v-type proton ATPase subunit F-like protein [Perkinsela sp. CCAP 1560/4]|eukprot:KNH09779.1 v-type proton ATPase subunit F-like protein [Perkinsela sp. CCAP 1560/4]